MDARTAVATLKFVAWLAFGVCLLAGAAVIFTLYKSPIFILVGAGIMLEGLFVWSLFYVVALIGHKLLIEPYEYRDSEPSRVVHIRPRYKPPL